MDTEVQFCNQSYIYNHFFLIGSYFILVLFLPFSFWEFFPCRKFNDVGKHFCAELESFFVEERIICHPQSEKAQSREGMVNRKSDQLETYAKKKALVIWCKHNYRVMFVLILVVCKNITYRPQIMFYCCHN